MVLCSIIRNNTVLLDKTIENIKCGAVEAAVIFAVQECHGLVTPKRKIIFCGFWYINTRCLWRFSRKMRCVCALTSHSNELYSLFFLVKSIRKLFFVGGRQMLKQMDFILRVFLYLYHTIVFEGVHLSPWNSFFYFYNFTEFKLLIYS